MQVQTLSTDAALYGEREVLFTTVKYQGGKMVETNYYRADTVELSDNAIKQSVVPKESENYNSLVREINTMSLVPHNQMFYETMDIMKDFYAGNIDKEQVKDFYKQYCTSFLGKPDGCMTEMWKNKITRGLSDMYEYFCRANSRAACACNSREGSEISEDINGGRVTAYYNSQYYYSCQEMQEMFRSISDELAEEYGCAKVDFDSVEKNTKFQLDGGITYNGVWDFVNMNTSRSGAKRAVEMEDKNFVPPRNFVYFACNLTEQFDAEKLNEKIKKLCSMQKLSQHDILTLFSNQAERSSLLAEQIGKDKEAVLFGGYNFVKSLIFHNVYDRAECCSIGK